MTFHPYHSHLYLYDATTFYCNVFQNLDMETIHLLQRSAYLTKTNIPKEWRDGNVQKSVETLSYYAAVSSTKGETFNFTDSLSQSLCRALNEKLNNEEECIEAALATMILEPAQLANIRSLWKYAGRYPLLTVKYSLVASFICHHMLATGRFVEALSFAMNEANRYNEAFGEGNVYSNALFDQWVEYIDEEFVADQDWHMTDETTQTLPS